MPVQQHPGAHSWVQIYGSEEYIGITKNYTRQDYYNLLEICLNGGERNYNMKGAIPTNQRPNQFYRYLTFGYEPMGLIRG